MHAKHLCFALALATGGCAIRQNVTPVASVEGKEICIIENSEVTNPVILETYISALYEKGYAVKILPASAKFTDCAVTSTYRGHWLRDMRLYLAYAEIKVYRGGRKIGEASYDTSGGAMSFDKFKKPEETIFDMARQLFPYTATE